MADWVDGHDAADRGSGTFVVNACGRKIFVDPQDERGQQLLRTSGNFNPGSLQLWKKVVGLADWDAVLDIGANYGEMLLGVDGLTQASTVVAYEPNPQTARWLRRSLGDAQLSVDVRPVAVGAPGPSIATFTVDSTWSGTSGLSESLAHLADHATHSIEVGLTTLDAELSHPAAAHWRSICIKVDVEGAEDDVIAGGANLLGSDRTFALMLEILHLSTFEISELARQYDFYMYDRRTDSLVLVPHVTADPIKDLLNSGWLYRQDAVILSADLKELVAS